MSALAITKAISGIAAFATTMIILVFGNFLLRKADATVLGVAVPSRFVHAVIGPVLVLLNGVLLLYLCALYRTNVAAAEVAQIQHAQQYKLLGALFNPFYISRNAAINAIGYAFLIVLWWLGMHAFLYSIGLNKDSTGPWFFGWQTLITVMYLALGLSSMWAIQACWYKFGIHDYDSKLIAAFLGIPIGAFVPPLVLKLGSPLLPFR